MSHDTTLPLSFPAVGRKKLTAAFDGGRITSDGGVLLLVRAIALFDGVLSGFFDGLPATASRLL